MKKVLLHFWKVFIAVFLIYLTCSGNLFAFDVKMLDLYSGMFSYIPIVWLRYCAEVTVFILLTASIGCNLKTVIEKDKKENGNR
jgi:hypothetical protein